MQDFFQDAPKLGNQFDADELLQRFLRARLPEDVQRDVVPDLRHMGQRAVHDVLELGVQAEAEPPKHVPFDPWGRRIDALQVSDAWKKLDRVAAEEGLIAIGYDRAHGSWSRIHQLAKLYLYAPSSAVYSCPLAMTDGAARAIELYGDTPLKARAFFRLTSRDPAHFWTSGQWMTERSGGSDVSGTATVARRVGDGYALYGDKWFTSATTSQMAMMLARLEGAPSGSKGLSLFYAELRDDHGQLQNLRIHRLKDKLGTRALPTAELSLEGLPAQLVGDPGHGVRKIASLFNITRIYNAVCAVAGMRRAIALAQDYARRRQAFGKTLDQHPLHVETLGALQLELEAGFHLTFHVVGLLGREELGEASAEDSALLRLLTPILKLYTGKQAVAVASEVLECFGGAGYVEDTGLPRLLRDAQVLSIWEGTTNVLSLDLLRAISREQALPPFVQDVRNRLKGPHAAALQPSVDRVKNALTQTLAHLEKFQDDALATETGARGLAFSLARIYAGSLLIEHAQWAMEHATTLHRGAEQARIAAQRWCAQPLTLLVESDEMWQTESLIMAGVS